MLLHVAVMTWTLLVQAQPERLTVFYAGSLSVPLEAVEKEFRRIDPSVEVRRESAGSVESARKIADLHREADIVAVADHKVIEGILFPDHASWSIIFARNHMVIAYTDKSRFAGEINPSNWYEVLLRPGVEFGRSDPERDPCGYRTLMVWQLAERFYGKPGLNEKLLEGCPKRNIRPQEVDIVALQEAGDIDYHFQYMSVAEQHKLKYLRLPPQIDLGSYQFKDMYATAQVMIHGKKRGEKITLTGEPILYAVTIPRNAPHPELAERFLALLLGPEGRKIFKDNGQEPVSPPLAVNLKEIPEGLRKLVVPITSLDQGKTAKVSAQPLEKGMAVLDIYKDGTLLRRLNRDNAGELPQAEEKLYELSPAWRLTDLLDYLNIPADTVGKIRITDALGDTLDIPGKELKSTAAIYIMGYNRKKFINLKIKGEQGNPALKGRAGHGSGEVRQITKMEVFE